MLKKTIRLSLIISCAITLIAEAFNLLMYSTEKDIIGFVFQGGDIVQKSLLGLVYSHYYPETNIMEPYTGPHTSLSFNIAGFLGGIALIFAASFALIAVISLILRGKRRQG